MGALPGMGWGSRCPKGRDARGGLGGSVSCYSGVVSSCCHCVSSLGCPVDKLSRCGLVEALVALVAWKNRGMRSLRARKDLVQPRAPCTCLGPGDCCMERKAAPGPASPTGPGSTCPPLLIRGSGMCDIDDTLVAGPIVGCCGAPGAGAGELDRAGAGHFRALLLPIPLPSSLYEDLLFSS